LSKFSDTWTIDKTHNKFLAHELKMRFKLLNFERKLFLMLLKKTPPPALGNLSLSNLCSCYIISIPKQSIFIKNFMTWTNLWNWEPFIVKAEYTFRKCVTGQNYGRVFNEPLCNFDFDVSYIRKTPWIIYINCRIYATFEICVIFFQGGFVEWKYLD
jgi:hypothetical protein